MNTPGEEERPKSALGDWRVAPPRDPEFRARVWTRIEAAKSVGAAGSWPHYVRGRAAGFAGGLAIAVAIGAVTGRERARAQAEAESSRLATAYVLSLDARTMTMP